MQDQTDDYDGAFIKTLSFVIYKNTFYWFMHYKTWGLDKHITTKWWVQEYNGTNTYTSWQSAQETIQFPRINVLRFFKILIIFLMHIGCLLGMDWLVRNIFTAYCFRLTRYRLTGSLSFSPRRSSPTSCWRPWTGSSSCWGQTATSCTPARVWPASWATFRPPCTTPPSTRWLLTATRSLSTTLSTPAPH